MQQVAFAMNSEESLAVEQEGGRVSLWRGTESVG